MATVKIDSVKEGVDLAEYFCYLLSATLEGVDLAEYFQYLLSATLSLQLKVVGLVHQVLSGGTELAIGLMQQAMFPFTSTTHTGIATRTTAVSIPRTASTAVAIETHTGMEGGHTLFFVSVSHYSTPPPPPPPPPLSLSHVHTHTHTHTQGVLQSQMVQLTRHRATTPARSTVSVSDLWIMYRVWLVLLLSLCTVLSCLFL